MEKGFLGREEISKEDLALINKQTKRSLNADEVYAFSVTLCDNDIDRDFERFTPEALHKLATLYVGKTGIFDHSMKGRDQIARIYSCAVEETGETTQDGMPYVRLRAKAYLPRTPKTEEFILNLEAGITKEVSVGCSVDKKICSICGADAKREFCGHRKGEVYGEGINRKQCHFDLIDPIDAYEWSFVAVPAQRRAGVIKAMGSKKGELNMNTGDIVKSLEKGGLSLSDEQAKALYGEFSALSEIKKEYLEDIKAEIVKSCADVLPELKGEALEGVLNSLSPRLLKEFKNALSQKKNRSAVQLVSDGNKQERGNNEFVI